MQSAGCRVDRKRSVRHDTSVMPALSLIIIHDKHVVCVVLAKPKSVLVRFFLR